MAPTGVAVLVAAVLAITHVVAGRLRVFQVLPRNWWLSAAGGVSVAYVFVHLLPEVTERQSHVAVDPETSTAIGAVLGERAIFVAALLGFGLFYGVEQAARCSSRDGDDGAVVGGGETETSAGVFWLHVGSFAAYNALVGYLLLNREEAGVAGLVLYGTAMALHFVVNDVALRELHRDAYHHVGRWLLAGAVAVGLLVGWRWHAPERVVGLLLAFLAGGIVLNVIKEELPEERNSQFSAFAAGAVGYTVLLLLV